MYRKRNLAAMGLIAAAAVSCGKNDSKGTPEETPAPVDQRPEGGGGGDPGVSMISGTLSINLLPSLNDAAGSTGASLLLAPSGVAPSFKQLQEEYLTTAAKNALFGSGQDGNFACQAINKTARSISKFLSMDSNLCMFKELGNGYSAGKSWLTVNSGTVGEEGLFGQRATDKTVKVAVPMGSEGTMNVLFDIKGSGSDASDGYELKFRMCRNNQLASVQVVTIDRATGKVSIRYNDQAETFSEPEEASQKEDNFVGYMKKDGTGWDLTLDREFSYDMYGNNQYQALVAKFTKEGQIVTTETSISSVGNYPGTYVSYSASTTQGSNAVNLALTENYFKRLDNSTVTTGGMEFVNTQFQAAESAVLKAIVDALPTSGRYVERPSSYSLPLLEGIDCAMDAPDVEVTFDMQTADPEIALVCDTILTDSRAEADANGNPLVRNGDYCSSVGAN